MSEHVLLGDEAAALGATHAGISCAFGYPGTPSTEILEYLIEEYERGKKSGKSDMPFAQWCTNEKTAYESALGVSFAGKRSIVTMKHVGLNVAADSFINSALVGIKGGLVLCVADDPSMHSSQDEQDSRFYADFAGIPCFEPTTQQETYDMMFDAFELSEKFAVPVMLRLVTRLSHSRAGIKTKPHNERKKQNPLSKANRMEWMLIPALARKNYEKLLTKQNELVNWANKSHWNSLSINKNGADTAIITSGLGKNYLLENLAEYTDFCKTHKKELPSMLHIGTLPVPDDLLAQLASTVKSILVIEEGMPFLEKQLLGLLPKSAKTIQILGKLSGHLPRTGELNPDYIRKALGLQANKSVSVPEVTDFCTKLPSRPPQLCKGCPHIDSYESLNAAVAELIKKSDAENVVVASDIGCYALGAVPPYNAVESIVCMGASIGMARGAAIAGAKYSFGVIGDSTFLHSGITNLIDAVSSKTPITVIILDNSIVAMTGCQTTILPSSQLEALIFGLGVEKNHIRLLEATPAKRAENAKIIQEEAEYQGVSVIIMVRECLEAFKKRQKEKKL